MPAEWEPHRATWLTWPDSRDWPGKLNAVRWTYTEVIRRLVKNEAVQLIVEDARSQELASRMLSEAGVDLTSIQFFSQKTNRTWARDNLPTFVAATSPGRLGAVKWRFNGWARYKDFQLDDQAGVSVARRAAPFVWQPKRHMNAGPSRIVLEGGSIDVDGDGTLLTTRRCLLGSPFSRNPGLSREALEQLLRDYLGVTQVLWLDDGIAGDDTSGHVDDFARFVAPGRVVVATEPNPSDANHLPLLQAKQALASFRDARGRRLDVVDLPMPDPVVYRGERLPASYANFYIANDQVLVPTFNDAKDRLALSILAEVFPSRDVIGIHATDLVVGLGTLHCSTQQEPAIEQAPAPAPAP